jgi:hypothetical protein
MMASPREYDESQSFLQPHHSGDKLGVDCVWMNGRENEEEGEENGESGKGSEKGRSVRMRLVRRGSSDATPNGMAFFMLPDSALMYEME